MDFKERIFNINSNEDFLEATRAVFSFQYSENSLYRQWCELLKRTPENTKTLDNIPFLPIELFKTNRVLSGNSENTDIVFTSSSTTSQVPARHFVKDVRVYEKSFSKGFELFYGDPGQYCILALLPNYLERGGSSLVYMADRLIKESKHEKSGFYLNNFSELVQTIEALKASNEKVLLLGVSYALIDLSKLVRLNDNFIVMETGGMKGKRKEMLKAELHAELKQGFGINNIHSEYGMTELLSQSYSLKDGVFETPPWMKILVRDVEDPLSYLPSGRTGGLNIIDLANFNSCSFIATKDLGKSDDFGNIQLMGRFDNSDIRGCNLMLEN